MEPPLIEIRPPGGPVRRVALTGAVEIGRDCEGEVVADDEVSRRHLRLVPSPSSLSIVDLDSTNGTLVNGIRLTGRGSLSAGDVVRIGGTEIVVISRPSQMPQRSPRATIMAPLAPVPVPAPVAVAAPPAPPSILSRLLGEVTAPDEPVFPNYTELPSVLPRNVWHGIRVLSILTYIALCVGLFVRPAGGQFAFFKIIVPLLPILFFVAPGLWRNICPLAASNQTPRVLGFTRGLTTPAWLAKRAYIIAIVLFFGITGARLALFNTNATATGILLSITIVNAFAMGWLFKGKSGWCSSICPLLPLQRVYGQTPFVTVPNSHCAPCVGCTKNCYDFKPRVAYQADMHDPDPGWSAPRKVFVGALPGYVLGFFTLLTPHHITRLHLYGELAAYLLGSVGAFFALDAAVPLTTSVLASLFGAAALNIFYWYVSLTFVSDLHQIFGIDVPVLRWFVRAVVLALTLVWIVRTRVVEKLFDQETGVTTPVTLGRNAAKALAATGPAESEATVRFGPDAEPINAEVGASLLEIAERSGQTIEAGCRMGVCGADPIAVLEGMACLSAPEKEEGDTLRRLGFASNTRMACCARISAGSVAISLTPQPGGPSADDAPLVYDRSIVSVVVLGNGIAGVTAADFVRRGHPDCEIHIVGRESHVLYNRMGISRLVYGRSAMQGLFLLPEQWYDDHGVVAWLNTRATSIDVVSRQVLLGTGEVLPYDRLILATGSSSVVPPITGIDRPGSFVLREAGDAIAIRAYAQEHGARTAVVTGGGLLGLEAAHSLRELGLHVTILERGARLLGRQIDSRCSELVHEHFAWLGMEVQYGAEADVLSSDALTLKDGRILPCDVFLAAVGIKPNTELAADAGLEVNRGVVVDDRMETSVPGIFAAGDVAEHDGRVWGLWPVAAKQGEVAAMNALGGSEVLASEVPATILKGVGLELTSLGRFEPEPGDDVIVVEDPSLPSYRRLVLSQGRVVGAVVLGHHPQDLTAATAAVKAGARVDSAAQAAIRDGDWSVLAAAARASGTPVAAH